MIWLRLISFNGCLFSWLKNSLVHRLLVCALFCYYGQF